MYKCLAIYNQHKIIKKTNISKVHNSNLRESSKYKKPYT